SGLNRQVVFPTPAHLGDEVTGQVLHVDAFGNLVTNLEVGAIGGLREVELAGFPVAGPVGSYAEAPEGHLVAIAGSSGLLEISVKNGSAKEATGVSRGARVRARMRKEPAP